MKKFIFYFIFFSGLLSCIQAYAAEYQTTSIYMINIPIERPFHGDIIMLDALNLQNNVTILPKSCNFVQLNYIWNNVENNSQLIVLQLRIPVKEWKSMKTNLIDYIVAGYNPVVDYLQKKGK